MSERSEIDLKKVEKLIDLMKEHDLIEVELVDGKSRVHLRRPEPPGAPAGPTILPIATGMPGATAALGPGATPEAAPAGGAETNVVEIPSPMIGTFYSSPGPDAEPYVRVGSKIRPGTVVCIVEAMKVMNEIKADVSGTITDVLCKAGEPVEFGQPLFRVRPES